MPSAGSSLIADLVRRWRTQTVAIEWLRRWGWLLVALAWLLVALPPMGRLLESTMLAHMLLQMPLLAAGGIALGRGLAHARPAWVQACRPYRWALLACAGFTMLVWMIPYLLDRAVEEAWVDVAKALSLALLGGLPLALAWPLFGPVVRGLVHMEVLATLLRLGWLYLESPARLCTRYALDDQARLGQWMLVLGAVYAVWLAMKALGFGGLWRQLLQAVRVRSR